MVGRSCQSATYQSKSIPQAAVIRIYPICLVTLHRYGYGYSVIFAAKHSEDQSSERSCKGPCWTSFSSATSSILLSFIGSCRPSLDTYLEREALTMSFIITCPVSPLEHPMLGVPLGHCPISRLLGS